MNRQEDFIDRKTTDREFKPDVDTDFTEKSWKEDLTLIVEGEKLYVAKNILGLVSPVFERMFQADFKEASQAEIQLPGKKLNDVKEFLRCFYPNKENEVSENNVYKILPLADEYQVFRLKSKCEALLLNILKRSRQVSEIYRLLNVASQHNLEEVIEAGIQLVSKRHLHELDEADKLVSIPVEIKSAINRKVMENLQQSVDMLTEELQRVKTVNNFHRGGLLKAEQLDADHYSGCSSTSLMLSLEEIKTNSYPRFEDARINICGTYVTWTFVMKSFNDFWFSIDCPKICESKIRNISLVFKVILVNASKQKTDYCKIYQHRITRQNRNKEFHIGSSNEIKEYLYNDRLNVEIHLLAKENK